MRKLVSFEQISDFENRKTYYRVLDAEGDIFYAGPSRKDARKAYRHAAEQIRSGSRVEPLASTQERSKCQDCVRKIEISEGFSVVPKGVYSAGS